MKSTREIIKKFNLLLIILFLFSGFTSPLNNIYTAWVAPVAADSIKNPLGYSDENFYKGKKIFDNLCWTCHGLDGKGNGPVAQTLAIKPADFSNQIVQQQSDGAIYWKISTGRGSMASYNQVLNQTQRWQLVQYLRNFKSPVLNSINK